MKSAHSVSPTHPAPQSPSSTVGRVSIPANGHQTRDIGPVDSVPANDEAASSSVVPRGDTGGPAAEAYPDVAG